jgi:hypothetical protein
MLGGGSDARTIGQACRRGAAGHRATFRALRRLRLHTRVKRQRQKARSEISVGNDAARAAKSGAVAPRARVLRPGVFCPGEGRGRGAAGWMCREGFGGQSAIVPPTRMIVSLQRRLTARSPLKVSDARPSRSSLMCDSSSVSWYNHAHARRASAHRHRRPSRWLAKSCVANATSVSKAAWLGQPRPTPAARARWRPRACSLSARGGRCELDASPAIAGRRGLGQAPRFTPARFFSSPPPVSDRAIVAYGRLVA